MKFIQKYWWVLLILAVVILLLLTRKKSTADTTTGSNNAKSNLQDLGNFFKNSPGSSIPESDSARINEWNSWVFKNQQFINNFGNL